MRPEILRFRFQNHTAKADTPETLNGRGLPRGSNMPSVDVSDSRKPLFTPGLAGRMWSRFWPFIAFYVFAGQAAALRAIADDVGFPVRRSFTLVEEILLTTAPTHWLQGSFIDVRFSQLGATTVYITWSLVPLTTGIGVLMFRPKDYWRFISFLVLMYVAVMPLFALYPLEAPWAHDPEVRRFLTETFPGVAGKDPNPYAAMPSLHVALIAAAALWYGLGSAMGRIVFAYSALMSLVVVYGGDHYVADVFGGYAVALAVYGVARRLRLPLFVWGSPELHAVPVELQQTPKLAA